MAQAQTPTINVLSSNATNFVTSSSIAPGELVFINGTNLGDATAVNCGSATGFGTTCGTVSVMVAGKAAGVRTENAGLILIEVPVDAPLGNGKLVVTHTVGGQNLVSAPYSVTLVATTPELYITNVNNVVFGDCFNMPANTLINPSNPATPGGTVRCLGTGFGATNPVSPTGTVATAPLPPLVAPVTVSVGGTNAAIVSATLQGSIVGEDQIVFTMPTNLFTGNLPLVVTSGGVTTVVNYLLPVAVAGPSVTSVSNSASNILPGLPNAGIAQGSIFILKGSGLGPASISIAPVAFQSTILSNTSVAVTVGGTTVNAPMYYTSDGQVAALLPSNTPVGTGSVTVIYNGKAGNAAPITVVANNVGIFTLDSSGQGPGILTYADNTLVSAAKAADCGSLLTSCGAANPGDTLVLWATGLGPITGNDAAGDGLGVAIKAPLTLWLGGVSITPSYQGRSGCCVGEDQIVFTIPQNVPTGCAVPLLIQINDQISNNTVLPVAPKGSRTCPPTNPTFASINAEQTVLAGPLSFSSITLSHNSGGGGAFEDDSKFQFLIIPTYTPGTQPFFISFVDDTPLGTCLAYNNLDPGSNVPAATFAGLNAGTVFNVKGPNGSLPVTGSAGEFTPVLDATGKFLVPGSFTVTGVGGSDVGSFSATGTIPTPPVLTSPANNGTATRSNGLTVTWTGGSGPLKIVVQSSTDNTNSNGAAAICTVDASAGSLTIPPYIMQALPAGGTAGFTLETDSTTPFQAKGINLGIFELSTQVAGFGPGWGSGNFTLK